MATTVSLMITCLGDVLRPTAGVATVRLLRRLGVAVEFPEAQTCCGQPFFNSGYRDGARRLAKHTIGTFDDGRPVVVPSGSCAAMVKLEYPHLFPEGSPWKQRAEDLAARTFELCDFLVNQIGVVDVGARFEGSVTYHYACHLRGLGLTDEAPRLLQAIEGVRYMPIERQDQCCGFGGSFAVRYPHVSGAMVEDKVGCVTRTGADVVASTDAGCLMNIGGYLRRRGLGTRAMHLVELLEHQ